MVSLDSMHWNYGGGASSLSWQHTITQDLGLNGLIVVVSAGQENDGQTNPEETNSIYFNGVAMTKVRDANRDREGLSMYELHGANVPPPGTYTVTVYYNGTGTPNRSRGISTAWKQIKNQAVEGSNYQTADDGGGGNRNTSITPLSYNALVLACFEERTDVGWTQNSNFTQLLEIREGTVGCRMGLFYKIVPDKSLTTFSMNFVNPEQNEMIIASFEPAPVSAVVDLF